MVVGPKARPGICSPGRQAAAAVAAAAGGSRAPR